MADELWKTQKKQRMCWNLCHLAIMINISPEVTQTSWKNEWRISAPPQHEPKIHILLYQCLPFVYCFNLWSSPFHYFIWFLFQQLTGVGRRSSRRGRDLPNIHGQGKSQVEDLFSTQHLHNMPDKMIRIINLILGGPRVHRSGLLRAMKTGKILQMMENGNTED